MRIKEILATGALLALGITLVPGTAGAVENVIPMGACKVLNQKVVVQNKTYTCTKSGKKLIWNKGVPVVAQAPTATPTPIATPATSPSPSPVPAPAPITTATPTPDSASPAATCSRNKNSLKNC